MWENPYNQNLKSIPFLIINKRRVLRFTDATFSNSNGKSTHGFITFSNDSIVFAGTYKWLRRVSAKEADPLCHEKG